MHKQRGMGLLSKIFSNTRKPEGFWGRMMVNGMNGGSHAALPFKDDGLSGNNAKWEKIIDGMHTYTPDELEGHLTAAGFKDIAVRRDETKHWLMVTANK